MKAFELLAVIADATECCGFFDIDEYYESVILEPDGDSCWKLRYESVEFSFASPLNKAKDIYLKCCVKAYEQQFDLYADHIIDAVFRSESGEYGFHSISASQLENLNIYQFEEVYIDGDSYLARILTDSRILYLSYIEHVSFNCDVFNNLNEAAAFFNECIANK